VIGESPEVYREWRKLLTVYDVSGVEAHDARLVAAMKAHGITRILTFDVEDFTHYKEIEVVHPQTVAQ
jgi:predicted nucleic acid-binding protein